VSPEWIEASASTYSPLPVAFIVNGFVGYSYGWWVRSNEYGSGAYAASGWGGQQLIVMPEFDMVVVFTGGSYWEAPALNPHQMMIRYVLPALG
jgi:CubicO group peptidase (beta-lactamase class C family)